MILSNPRREVLVTMMLDWRVYRTYDTEQPTRDGSGRDGNQDGDFQHTTRGTARAALQEWL